MKTFNLLTKREGEVIHLLARGKPNKEIAADLGITENTLESHLKHIYKKLKTRGRMEAALIYMKDENHGNP